MKVRKGFVSNSSSSSFIVKLTESFENGVETVQREMICPCCGSKYRHHFNTVFNYIDGLCYYEEDEKTASILKESYLLSDYKDREDLGRIFVIELDRCNTERRDAIYNEIDNGNLELIEVICN
jgi:hypothetical protein